MSTQAPALTTSGRIVRWAGVGIVLALVVAGTLYGQDDHFPFGPFRMYATANDGNRPVKSTRMEGVRADGDRVRLSGGAMGMRRAEIEGQLPRLTHDPQLLGALATAYAERHPDAPKIVEIEIIQRDYELADREPTGKFTDRVLARWRATDGAA